MTKIHSDLASRFGGWVAVAAIMTCVAVPAHAQRAPGDKGREGAARNAALTDQLFLDALENGMSIIVTATINLDHKYPNKDAMIDNSALYTSSRTGTFVIDRTSTSVWKGQRPESFFTVGNDSDFKSGELDRAFYSFTSGGTRYMVYIVAPGTYTLTGGSYKLPRTRAPRAGASRGTGGASRIGQVSFRETKFSEYQMGQEWRNAAYVTETVKSNYCAMAIAGSDQCVQWGTYTDNVTSQGRAAGYYKTTKEVKVDGVEVQAILTTPFASFTARPGEILLVDGLFAENPAPSFTEKGCERIKSDQVNCALTGYDLTRIRALPEDMARANAAARGFPKLGKILTRIQYRELTMAAKLGTEKRDNRQVYFVELRK
ncbi:hypothetical protein OK349_11060 [Sphingomonas sp. BT-65]|uniref:hypothetical protein n=1 Tax=Sphingomonas sp. BT-65 TaxID=2989821 RepID=UPI002235FBB1|nr:hypothetical protein [Sphingomonas sp. BT-65]MCW4462246.1 hypothetical protein [Sphingomonas sp. BT-65]